MRVLTAAFGSVAVVALTGAPALAAGSDPAPIASYPAASAAPSTAPSANSGTGGVQVQGEVKTRVKPVKVAAVQVSRQAPAQPSGALAFTGSDAIIGGLVLGSGLVVVGGGLVLGGRRKRATA